MSLPPARQPDLAASIASLSGGRRGLADGWPWTLLALLAAAPFIWLTVWPNPDANASTPNELAPTLASGLLALVAVSVAVVVMSIPLLLSARFAALIDKPVEAKAAMRRVVAVYWVNLQWMFGASVFALTLAVMSQLPLAGAADYVASFVPSCAVIVIHRCWLLLRQSLQLVIAAINSLPDGPDASG